MDLHPIRMHEHEISDKGKVHLKVPRFKNKSMEKLFVPARKKPYFIIKLDELGSAVWLEIDGKKNVSLICRNLTEKLGEKIEPVEERVGKFMSLLYNQRYISFKELNTN